MQHPQPEVKMAVWSYVCAAAPLLPPAAKNPAAVYCASSVSGVVPDGWSPSPSNPADEAVAAQQSLRYVLAPLPDVPTVLSRLWHRPSLQLRSLRPVLVQDAAIASLRVFRSVQYVCVYDQLHQQYATHPRRDEITQKLLGWGVPRRSGAFDTSAVLCVGWSRLAQAWVDKMDLLDLWGMPEIALAATMNWANPHEELGYLPGHGGQSPWFAAC